MKKEKLLEERLQKELDDETAKIVIDNDYVSQESFKGEFKDLSFDFPVTCPNLNLSWKDSKN